jgi:hypothetical protein
MSFVLGRVLLNYIGFLDFFLLAVDFTLFFLKWVHLYGLESANNDGGADGAEYLQVLRSSFCSCFVSGLTSPMMGKPVTVEGIVTCYIQDR